MPSSSPARCRCTCTSFIDARRCRPRSRHPRGGEGASLGDRPAVPDGSHRCRDELVNMADYELTEFRRLLRLSAEERTGVDDKQVQGFGTARHDLDRRIAESADQQREDIPRDAQPHETDRHWANNRETLQSARRQQCVPLLELRFPIVLLGGCCGRSNLTAKRRSSSLPETRHATAGIHPRCRCRPNSGTDAPARTDVPAFATSPTGRVVHGAHRRPAQSR